jgi:hypothetical protein
LFKRKPVAVVRYGKMTNIVWTGEWFIIDSRFLNLVKPNATKEDSHGVIEAVGHIQSLQHTTKNVPLKCKYCWKVHIKNGKCIIVLM